MAAPMFTRRHHKALALAIGEGRAKELGGHNTAQSIANTLAGDNPSFNRTNFLIDISVAFDAECQKSCHRGDN